MKKYILVILLILSVLLTACGGKQNTSADEEAQQTEEEAGKKETKNKKKRPDKKQNEEGKKVAQSLALRLCGKYSYHAEDEDEYYLLTLVAFGDNLYAYCEEAMDDEGEIITYSFWASELIPEDAKDMSSTDGDSVDVKALSFSVMSNAGQYWNSGIEGTVSLADGGVAFTGFDDGFLSSGDEERVFEKDDSFEGLFPYLSGEKNGSEELQGYWESNGPATPVYLRFDGSDIYLYQKAPDKEVYFAGGSYTEDSGTLSVTCSMLGNGGMPDEWEAEIKADGDQLILYAQDMGLEGLEGETVFEKTTASSIPVFTADQISLSADSFGPFGDGINESIPDDENGFYGVWIASVKDYDLAVAAAEKIADKGYRSEVIFSQEWENLNQKPLYCVTAERYYSEDEANDALAKIQKLGFSDAFVKHTGDHKFITVMYTNTGDVQTEILDDAIILKEVNVTPSRTWYPLYDDYDVGYTKRLIIDKNTVFDDTCDLEFFGNYEKGDSAYDWYLRNLDLMENDPDAYLQYGPALSGVFEIGISGDHVDRFFGSYWWD